MDTFTTRLAYMGFNGENFAEILECQMLFENINMLFSVDRLADQAFDGLQSCNIYI